MRLEQISKPNTIAESVSESENLEKFGLSDFHVQDAMSKIAVFLLSSGANLAYGGVLRPNGFTQQLFELVQHYSRPGKQETRVVNYLAWPVHANFNHDDLDQLKSELDGAVELALLKKDGSRMKFESRQKLNSGLLTDDKWSVVLTAMRKTIRDESDARIWNLKESDFGHVMFIDPGHGNMSRINVMGPVTENTMSVKSE